MTEKIIKELIKVADKEKAKTLSSFFKTKKGQYAEGDKFLGVVVPKQRIIAKKYFLAIKLNDIEILIKNKYHEVRLTSLIMLNYKMLSADLIEQTKIYNLYLKNIKYINNWDLVDLTAPNIIGFYLYNNYPYKILYDLANSNKLWNQRIAILSTFYFIKNNSFDDALNIALILLNHNHDLIHKAVGWMLREIGKRDYKVEYNFLIKYYKKMPRTMLRYAIEKFDEEIRIKFLKGLI